MKKNIAIILLSILVLIMGLALSMSHADEELPPITIRVTREGNDVTIINPGEVYSCYKSCNFSGDRFELEFSSTITTYDYCLMTEKWDGRKYRESDTNNPVIYREARTIGNGINYLTVIGYNKDNEFVAQATFIIDTSYLYRERD